MRSKQLVRFYDEHCSRTLAKIAGCEKALSELKAQLHEMRTQAENLQYQLSIVWLETVGESVLQRHIYALKRREALILSRYEELQLLIQEKINSIEQLIETRDSFIKLRLHYEKKKNKWEWMSARAKKMRVKKEIHIDELAAEECVTWTIQ